MRVRNMRSPNGNNVPNQFIIYTDDGACYFQSYNTIIVKNTGSKTILDVNYWDYSNTTGKYRNIFLGESKKETERKIKCGIYKLEDLNK